VIITLSCGLVNAVLRSVVEVSRAKRCVHTLRYRHAQGVRARTAWEKQGRSACRCGRCASMQSRALVHVVTELVSKISTRNIQLSPSRGTHKPEICRNVWCEERHRWRQRAAVEGTGVQSFGSSLFPSFDSSHSMVCALWPTTRLPSNKYALLSVTLSSVLSEYSNATARIVPMSSALVSVPPRDCLGDLARKNTRPYLSICFDEPTKCTSLMSSRSTRFFRCRNPGHVLQHLCGLAHSPSPGRHRWASRPATAGIEAD
jgi:hypothetical protein